MAQEIYLDNSTVTRPSPQAVSRMLPFLTDFWGVPSQPHDKGQELMAPLAESLRSIYQLIGADDKDGFVLTSSGAEAANHVINSAYFDVTMVTGKNHFVTSHIDEAPSLMAINRLERMGCIGKMVEPNHHGQITAQIIADAITPRTALVSLSWANGLTGVIHPVAEIAALCQERGILLHLEASHLLGKIFYDLHEIGAHFITFRGDTLHAPKGTGGIYIRAKTRLSPFILGGIEQNNKRAGALDMAGMVGLGEAAREALLNRDYLCTEVARLRDRFESHVRAGFPEAVVLYDEQERLPHVTAIAFPGVANEALLYALNRKKVYACIGGGSFQQIGLILAAAGISDGLAQCAVSFSLSRDTDESDIERAAEIVVEAAKKLRKVSNVLYPLSSSL